MVKDNNLGHRKSAAFFVGGSVGTPYLCLAVSICRILDRRQVVIRSVPALFPQGRAPFYLFITQTTRFTRMYRQKIRRTARLQLRRITATKTMAAAARQRKTMRLVSSSL